MQCLLTLGIDEANPDATRCVGPRGGVRGVLGQFGEYAVAVPGAHQVGLGGRVLA